MEGSWFDGLSWNVIDPYSLRICASIYVVYASMNTGIVGAITRI